MEKCHWRAHNEVSAASGARVNPFMFKCNPRYPTFADIEIMRPNCGGSEKIGPTAARGNAALVRVAHDLGGLTGYQ